jgi:enamine deaminase RidA (YjgF/YER057c/UK114 family)
MDKPASGFSLSVHGYCRAVRAGSHVYVTGTAPVAECGGGVHAPGYATAQARRCSDATTTVEVRALIDPAMLIEVGPARGSSRAAQSADSNR